MSNSKRIISLTVVCLFALSAIIVNRAATRALSLTQTPQPPPKSQQEREALAKKPAPSGLLQILTFTTCDIDDLVLRGTVSETWRHDAMARARVKEKVRTQPGIPPPERK